MQNIKTALIYGFLVWVVPFVIAIFIFPLRQNDRPLFESIMPVVVTVITAFLSYKYFQKNKTESVKEGIRIGLLWLAISIGIDLLMFMQGPMKMGLIDYLKDIGITYLIIPAITISHSYLLHYKKVSS